MWMKWVVFVDIVIFFLVCVLGYVVGLGVVV